MGYDFCALDKETGDIVEISKKRKKRQGRDFFMADQKAAEDLVHIKDLNATDHRVLWYLLSKINYENKVIMSQSFMAKDADIQQSLVSKSIKKLREHGFIRTYNENGVNTYHVDESFARKGKQKEIVQQAL